MTGSFHISAVKRHRCADIWILRGQFCGAHLEIENDADRAGAQLLKAQQSGVRISTLELVQGIGTTTLVGTLPPHGSVILPMKLEPTSEKLDLAAQIGSRVGFFSQRLIFRRVGGRWCRATRIVRGGNNSERILLEKVDPDFPQGEWPAH